MSQSILISGGRVICPAQKIDRINDVLISNGKIQEIAKNIYRERALKISAKNKIVCPGLIDLHAHLRQPGGEGAETIETGLRAALAGGFTAVVAMPNTDPPIKTQSDVEFQISTARKLNLARLFVAAQISDEKNFHEFKNLKTAGAVALTNDGDDVDDPQILQKALRWARNFNLPIFTHAEEKNLSQNGVVAAGEIATKTGLAPIYKSAEILGIAKSLILARENNAAIHISHVSCAESVELIRNAKKDFSKISAEATPHHFSFNFSECENFNTNSKMYPPLQSEADRAAIVAGLADGTIDAIATDHAPHTAHSKSLPFALAPRGTIGLQTAFAAGITFLVREKKLSLFQFLEKMTAAPARILNLQNCGSLEIGNPGDVAIFDLNKKWTVDAQQFFSKSKNSIFDKKELFGICEKTIVGGELKFDFENSF